MRPQNDKERIQYSVKCLFQTKAGYVLVYQRRDMVNNGPVPTRQAPATEVYMATTLSPSDAMSTNGECSSDDDMDINWGWPNLGNCGWCGKWCYSDDDDL